MNDIKKINHEKMVRIIEGEGTCDGEILNDCKFYCNNPSTGIVTAIYIDTDGALWLEVFNSEKQAIEWLAD